MATYVSGFENTFYKEPTKWFGLQYHDRSSAPVECVCQDGAEWETGTGLTRMWEDITVSFKKIFPEVERLSTVNYESNIFSLRGTEKFSFYLKDIYLLLQKACFINMMNEIDNDLSLPKGHLNKESLNKEPQFAQEVWSLINREPVENGFTHPAEKILMEALVHQKKDVIRWIESILEHKNPYVVADIITCLGRVTEENHPDWAIEIISEALEHSNVAVRDAAAQALESWETSQVLGLLTNHKEKVPWLREYIGQIVTQLGSH